MSTRIAILLATWFGCGLSPKAPGTVGSLAALLIGVILHEYFGLVGWHFVVLAALFTLPAVWSASDADAKVLSPIARSAPRLPPPTATAGLTRM